MVTEEILELEKKKISVGGLLGKPLTLASFVDDVRSTFPSDFVKFVSEMEQARKLRNFGLFLLSASLHKDPFFAEHIFANLSERITPMLKDVSVQLDQTIARVKEGKRLKDELEALKKQPPRVEHHHHYHGGGGGMCVIV